MGLILKFIIVWEGILDFGLEYDCRFFVMVCFCIFGCIYRFIYCCFCVLLLLLILWYRCCFYFNFCLYGVKCFGGFFSFSVIGYNLFRMEWEFMLFFCVVCFDFMFGLCFKFCDVVILLVKNILNFIKMN